MIGALWTGISGLASHQTALDNESHNIANVNTVGYKSSRISFADQMYQDRIGKGSKILDSEKLYVQGNLKLTGVDYDMALSGNGFFTVLNTATNGTSEALYTRAGNFRMGDNGTLQDAAGNEVQGWAMSKIDPDSDVSSTNPNVDMFTSDYTKLLGTKIIRHSNYIETITAKATDYTATAKADATTIFEGAGAKTQKAKTADVEALISDYSKWLSALKDEPDGGSASSTAQVSQINFKTGDDGLVSTNGDQIYVYVDGTKYSQNYIPSTADIDFRVELWTNISAAERADLGLTDPGTVAVPAALTSTQLAVYDREASRIATYKALADNLSEIPGLRASMVSESNVTGTNNDVLQDDESFNLSTKIQNMYKGIIQIESLIPGKSFSITEVGESSGSNSVAGAFQTSIDAVEGTGIGALESSREALSKVITGKQQDVYTSSDLGLDGSTNLDFTYGMTIYDKDAGKNIPVPGLDSSTPAIPYNITIPSSSTIDDIVHYINGTNSTTNTPAQAHNGYMYQDDNGNSVTSSSFDLSSYVVAKNVNGSLVIETLDDNFDVDFSGNMEYDIAAPGTPIAAGGPTGTTYTLAGAGLPFVGGMEYTLAYNDGSAQTLTITNPSSLSDLASQIATGTGYTATVTGTTISIDTGGANSITSLTHAANTSPIDKNNDYSGRQGAGAEFIELVNTIEQTSTQDSLQLKLDTLGISDSAFGEFSVDSDGVISMTQDGVEFAIGQVSIALFNNNRGLEPSGDNLLAKTTESGDPIYNLNNEKTAKIEGQTLELSTADLSESLVNLMVFQRAFEANAKSITTSDELLNTLINLKR